MSPVPSEYDADDFAGQELLQPQETGRGHREHNQVARNLAARQRREASRAERDCSTPIQSTQYQVAGFASTLQQLNYGTPYNESFMPMQQGMDHYGNSAWSTNMPQQVGLDGVPYMDQDFNNNNDYGVPYNTQGPFDQHIEDQSPQSITQPSAEGEDDAQATLLADQQAAATLPPGMNSMIRSTRVELAPPKRKLIRRAANAPPSTPTPPPPTRAGPVQLIRRAHLYERDPESGALRLRTSALAPNAGNTPSATPSSTLSSAPPPSSDQENTSPGYGNPALDHEDGITDDEDSAPAKKRKPTTGSLTIHRRRIVENGKAYVRMYLIDTNAFVSGASLDEALINAWIEGYREVVEGGVSLADNLKPEDDDLSVASQLKQVLSQHRSKVKSLGQELVIHYYGFKKGTGETTDVETINVNRKIYESLMAKKGTAFSYQDPSDTSIRGTFLRHKIIFAMIYQLWFGTEDSDGRRLTERFNPGGKGLPNSALALILAALRNCIYEYHAGFFKQRDFTAKDYEKHYVFYLKQIKNWHIYTTTKVDSRAAEKFCVELFESLSMAAGLVNPSSEGVDDDLSFEDFDAA